MVRWFQIGQIRGNVEAFLQDQRGSIFTIMGAGLVNKVQPAGEIVREIAEDAKRILKRLADNSPT